MNSNVLPPLMINTGISKNNEQLFSDINMFTDVQYNKLYTQLSSGILKSRYAKQIKITCSDPAIIESLIANVLDTQPLKVKTKKKYAILKFSSKNARNAAMSELSEIKANGKITYYDSKNIGITESGTRVNLTEALNYSGTVDANTGRVVADESKSSGSTETGSSKTAIYIVAAIVAIALIAGVIIIIKKR